MDEVPVGGNRRRIRRRVHLLNHRCAETGSRHFSGGGSTLRPSTRRLDGGR